MGEDALKLSKRLKNYQEPGLLFEKYSADACGGVFSPRIPPPAPAASPSATSKKHSAKLLIRLVQRLQLLCHLREPRWLRPLECIGSFFGKAWASTPPMHSGHTGEAPSCPATSGPNSTAGSSTSSTAPPSISATPGILRLQSRGTQLQAFVESLSNWYVRRSRDPVLGQQIGAPTRPTPTGPYSSAC